jgi:hypothetical protein
MLPENVWQSLLLSAIKYSLLYSYSLSIPILHFLLCSRPYRHLSTRLPHERDRVEDAPPRTRNKRRGRMVGVQKPMKKRIESADKGRACDRFKRNQLDQWTVWVPDSADRACFKQ